MTDREKKAISLALVAVFVFVFLQFLLLPMLADTRRLKKNIATQEKQLAEMQQLAAQAGPGGSKISGQSAMVEALNQRAKDFTLFSFLEQAAASTQVKEHIEAMQPVQSQQDEGTAAGGNSLHTQRVDVQVQGVSLGQLAHFLDLVESAQNLVAVERLIIQGGGREGALLNASLRVQSVEMRVDDAAGMQP
ncbi:MAG: type II secretion system protein M [Desulfobulbaceae bacterium]|nr:type II secretion system protein M [Desulfobulbaceae bacterium]